MKAVWGDYGTLIGSFVPPTDPWYVDLTSVDAYNPESAKELLKEAGYPDGFTFTIDTPNYDPHPIAAQFIQSELAKVGVKVNINIITANEWYTKVYKAHDFQATLQEHVNHRDIVFYGNPVSTGAITTRRLLTSSRKRKPAPRLTNRLPG